MKEWAIHPVSPEDFIKAFSQRSYTGRRTELSQPNICLINCYIRGVAAPLQKCPETLQQTSFLPFWSSHSSSAFQFQYLRFIKQQKRRNQTRTHLHFIQLWLNVRREVGCPAGEWVKRLSTKQVFIYDTDKHHTNRKETWRFCIFDELRIATSQQKTP